MNRMHEPVPFASTTLVVATSLLLLVATLATGAGASTGPFELRPGVIVDPGSQQMYMMSPSGGIDAVGLARGRVAWTTKNAAKPLAMAGGRLLAQAETVSAPGELKVVVLDLASRGKRMAGADFALPAGVVAGIDETPETIFTASARTVEQDAVVDWRYRERMPKGLERDPFAEEEEEEGEGLFGEVEPGGGEQSGVFRMSMATGEEVAAPLAGPPPAPRPAPDLAPGEGIPGVEGVQFVSADGRHVLVSERLAEGNVWEYRWKIYDRSSGEVVGEVQHGLSYAPFFVSGNRLIVETPTTFRGTEKGMVEEPLQIRALALASGKELWSRRVRDTAYRGPFPP